MIALLQRVSEAAVAIAGSTTAAIGAGLLVLVGVRPADTEHDAERLVERILGYRVFADDAGRMNLALRDIGGGLLLVPQFTLAAETRKGSRPGFSTAAAPEVAHRLFDHFVATAIIRHPGTLSGVFGADMQVSLINNGPVTIWLES